MACCRAQGLRLSHQGVWPLSCSQYHRRRVTAYVQLELLSSRASLVHAPPSFRAQPLSGARVFLGFDISCKRGQLLRCIHALLSTAGDLRAQFLDPNLDHQANVKLSSLPPALVDALWERFNEVVAVLHEANALGVVLFQFHCNFNATEEHLAYVAECRRRLRREFPMAVEFRSRSWYAATAPTAVWLFNSLAPDAARRAAGGVAGGAGASNAASVSGDGGGTFTYTAPPQNQKDATLRFFRAHNIINVASDDLAIELGQHEPPQPSMPDGRLLIYDDITSPDGAYLRLHRRRGDFRLLSDAEIDDWSARIHRIAATAAGPAGYAAATSPAISDLQYRATPVAGTGAGDSASSGAIATASGSAAAAAAALLSAAATPGGSAYPVRAITQADSYLTDLPYNPSSTPDTPAHFTRLRGPIFFMIGTDWEDQPMINLRKLAARVVADATAAMRIALERPIAFPLPQAEMLDWKALARAADAKHGLAAYFGGVGGGGFKAAPASAAAPIPSCAPGDGSASSVGDAALGSKRPRSGEGNPDGAPHTVGASESADAEGDNHDRRKRAATEAREHESGVTSSNSSGVAVSTSAQVTSPSRIQSPGRPQLSAGRSRSVAASSPARRAGGAAAAAGAAASKPAQSTNLLQYFAKRKDG